MRAVRLRVLATELGGRCRGDDIEITGAAIDSRRIQPGDLFIALPGEHADGHAFVEAAIEAGASAAMVRDFIAADVPQWRVDDPYRGLIELACWARASINARVIGVTGSNGKTTVKEMLARILNEQGATQATLGNLNNELGVPLTLCQLCPSSRYAVIEMGCGRTGDIALLASWARPDIGLVNNVSAAHLAGFGSVEAIAHCKGELFTALSADGYAVVNADDPYAALWEEQAAHCRIVRFSLRGEAAEVSGQVLEDGRLRVSFPAEEITLSVPLAGRHNHYNALAAATTAWVAGASTTAIQAGLAQVEPVAGRLQTLQGPVGSQLINDSYNANPASLRAALETATTDDARVWLVLGDMAELGEDAGAFHFEAGLFARSLGVERLYTLGPLSAQAATAFGKNSYNAKDHAALIAQLHSDLRSDVRVLIKGSRAARMDQVVAALSEPTGKEGAACC
ncbi:MAG: UDP-N-acetylmuramoyl-tripeptide--D-alanyl-D-alanine ligase [Spiribacter sp.]|jgi:UDP-N-acetylmuramoyl-tripeptide--D-alanyl-D-alanine ligase|nr:UDP-N-acetylmuramoyl-tripeptide--D-alanyl-D-alanine ligase [Spiribacter sp.]MDR9489466.1 UDP-N-acetylmuramoyl-tripeptide--D-alanyl-D-alanine ligase [Spiribacter sp.]